MRGMTRERSVCVVDTPVGWIRLEAQEGFLRRAFFCDARFETGIPHERMCAESPVFLSVENQHVFEEAKRWLDGYFAGSESTAPRPRLYPPGSAYEATVREALMQIPFGQTWTYQQLAERAAAPGTKPSPRAAGRALSRNPLLLFVPCHRVIGSDGTLRGYAGGLDRKRQLLDLEQNGSVSMPQAR